MTVSPVRILLVEDHRMFREWLGTMLMATGRFSVVAETDNGAEAIPLALSHKPDALLVDLGLRGSGGLELVKSLRSLQVHAPILILSMHEDALYAQRAIAAGANGYISKSEASSTLFSALDQIINGNFHLSSTAQTQILNSLASGKRHQGSPIDSLADRELEVFQLIGKGYNIPKIAELLNLGETTVGTYRARIKEKLQIRSAAELYALAARWLSENHA
jgi:DNA-binding NarL/FixJ family response regulator